MFKRKIRPAQEEMTGVLYSALFLLIWYAGLLRGILTSGFQSSYMLFLAAGIIPLFTAVQTVRRALFYRRQREEIKAAGNVSRGRIVNVIMKSSPYEDSHHRTRYRRYYFLEAEVADPGIFEENRVFDEYGTGALVCKVLVIIVMLFMLFHILFPGS